MLRHQTLRRQQQQQQQMGKARGKNSSSQTLSAGPPYCRCWGALAMGSSDPTPTNLCSKADTRIEIEVLEGCGFYKCSHSFGLRRERSHAFGHPYAAGVHHEHARGPRIRDVGWVPTYGVFRVKLHRRHHQDCRRSFCDGGGLLDGLSWFDGPYNFWYKVQRRFSPR